MFGLSLSEIGIILVVALLVIRPKDIPEIAQFIKKGMKSFRAATREFRTTWNEVKKELDLDDIEEIRKETRVIVNEAGEHFEAYDVSAITPYIKKKP